MQTPRPASVERGHLLGSIAFTAAAKLVTQIVSWACVLAVTRLLRPEDFGIVTMATVFLGFLGIFSEFGITATILNLRDLTDNSLRQLHTFSLLLGIGLFALIGISSPLAATFFRSDELVGVLRFMGAGIVFSTVRAVPNALLQRALRFRVLAVLECVQALVQALGTLALAWWGAGYWAVAIGGVSGTAVSALAQLAIANPGWKRPRPAELRRALSFSSAVLVSNLSWWAYSSADFAVAGRVLGKAAVGAYGVAWTIATLPAEKIAGIVMRVTPAYLAAHQEDHAALRRYLFQITEGVSVIVFPCAFGLALVADDFAAAVLGAKWSAVAAPLAILALYGGANSVVPILAQLLNAARKPRLAMWNSLMKVAALPVGFYLASPWGGVGIALIWVTVYPALTVPMYYWVFRAIGVKVRDYCRALKPALTGVAVMALVVTIVARQMPAGWPPALRLGCEVVGGALAYSAVFLLAFRDRASAYWAAFRGGKAAQVRTAAWAE